MIYEVEIYEGKGSNHPFGTAQVRLNAIIAIIWEDSTDKAKVLLPQGGVLFVKEYEGLRDAWNGSTGRRVMGTSPSSSRIWSAGIENGE